MFKIKPADKGLFSDGQLRFLRFDGAQMFAITESSEFGAKLREAKAAAKNSPVEIRFDGPVNLDADSAILLRESWDSNITVVPGDGTLNFTQTRHPTRPEVPNSLWGLYGKVNKVNWVLADLKDIHVDPEETNWVRELTPGGRPATVINDSTATLFRTRATVDKAAGTYVADVKNLQGELTDPIVFCYVYNGNITHTIDYLLHPMNTKLENLFLDTYNNTNGSLQMVRESYKIADSGKKLDFLISAYPVQNEQVNIHYSNDPKYINPFKTIAGETNYYNCIDYPDLVERAFFPYIGGTENTKIKVMTYNWGNTVFVESGKYFIGGTDDDMMLRVAKILAYYGYSFEDNPELKNYIIGAVAGGYSDMSRVQRLR
jgi:hypothetical protein